jgi:hypothetical protein
MQVERRNYKALNAWVRQAKQEGWQRPRDVAQQCNVWDPFDETNYGYCDVCGCAYADWDSLCRVKEMLRHEPGEFERLLTGGRDGMSFDGEDICSHCEAQRRREVEKMSH